MENCGTRPRLAVVVGGPLQDDARAERTAVAAVRAGWDVTLIGRSSSRRREERTLGGAAVVKVPVGTEMQERARLRATAPRGPHALLTRWGLHDERPLARAEAAHAAWVREHTARIGALAARRSAASAPLALLRTAPLRARVRVRRRLHRAVLRLYRADWLPGARGRNSARPTGNWRTDWPALLDLDLAYGPVVEELRPDVLYACGVTAVAAVARSAARLRARGLRTAWVYDARTYVAGTTWPDPGRAGALPAVEDEFAGLADAVVAPSDELARLLWQRHALSSAPLVVGDAPVRGTVGVARHTCPTVRSVCGLADEVPLLVHHGPVGAGRGVETAVEALGVLPGVHLALVGADPQDATLRALLDGAARSGTADRVHVAPRVPHAQVPDHLSSADLGLVCGRHAPDREVVLPTAVPEYLHAGLPVVSSDLRTARTFLQEHGVGVVHAAGEATALAAAVQQALDRRAELAANISGQLLHTLSWEQQSAPLLARFAALLPAPDGSASAAHRLVPREVPWPGSAERRDRQERRRPGVTVPDWRPVPAQGRPGQSRVRLGMGCANHAGQLSGFARALCRARTDVSVEVTMHTSGSPLNGYPADVKIPRGQLGAREAKLDRVNRVLGSYTHYLADAFTPAFGWLNGRHIEDDLPALRGAGIEVALLAHGSDVRDPERHRERYPDSLFHAAPEDTLAVLVRNSARNRRVAAESGLPLFATTPDLLDDLPGAQWAPLVVDVDAWACDRAVMERPRPVVVHAPSRRWTKGTERILPVLEELDRRGAIEFRLAEGLPWAGMRELVQGADIVVDQFAVGTYGTFACEGMAAGKPVVAFVDERVHKAVGAVPPIVNATAGTLHTALENLLDDRAMAAATGQESLAYVRAYHDGRHTARALDAFLT
ncbi:glycosyltransferase [Streptomyces sp. NRRL F-5053]|uniref:glycosyltransferase n=1 Tax=Streptomyces sp. NRRL F-5053 TaxID=1463854 RepID=UPI0004C8FCF0|nr:glycosyltransferase [Streptomyces sp. NRRL F-5053]